MILTVKTWRARSPLGCRGSKPVQLAALPSLPKVKIQQFPEMIFSAKERKLFEKIDHLTGPEVNFTAKDWKLIASDDEAVKIDGHINM